MSETRDFTTFRTYPFGARGRQLIDSASILMPGITKGKIINAAVFHMVHDLDAAMKDGRAMNIRQAFDVVMEPILSIAYEDLLKVVTPTNKNQTPLDDYIGIRVTRLNRDGTPAPEYDPDSLLYSDEDSLLDLLVDDMEFTVDPEDGEDDKEGEL